MIRLISAAVSVSLVLAVVAIDQYIIAKQPARSPNSVPKKAIINKSTDATVPVDNDQRGAHSYFLPPRLLSNRYPTTNGTITTMTSSHDPGTSKNLGSASEAAVIEPEEQDLLRSGYLRDNESNYKPAFGNSR